jgi:hypothetical protein
MEFEEAERKEKEAPNPKYPIFALMNKHKNAPQPTLHQTHRDISIQPNREV